MLVSSPRGIPARFWSKGVPSVGILGVPKVVFNTEGPSKGCYVFRKLAEVGGEGSGDKT